MESALKVCLIGYAVFFVVNAVSNYLYASLAGKNRAERTEYEFK